MAGVVQARPELETRDGVPLEEWVDEGGEKRVEVADGGTTATVICLLDGATLVHAQVGGGGRGRAAWPPSV